MSTQEAPLFWQYMDPILAVMRELGGSASIKDLEERVARVMGLSPDQVAIAHDPERGSQTEVGYRMAWARTYLRKVGLIENRARGIWALTNDGQRTAKVDGQAIAQQVRNTYQGEDEVEPESGPTATYLLAWNPTKFAWSELESKIRAVRETGGADETWSSGRAKNLVPGSRFFLIRLAAEPRGIVGAGSLLDAPREEPHWDEQKAADGETTHLVDIRFDALSRAPLIARSELDAAPFDTFKWDTQMSGVRIPEPVADALEGSWQKRVSNQRQGATAEPVTSDALERWRSYWSAAKTDRQWMERNEVRDAKRRDVLPEMRALMSAFIGGQVPLPEFRETFDRKTRNEWDVFGLKGMSGAMFLNKIAKYLPDPARAAAELQGALVVPATEESARAQLDTLMSFLEKQIESGAVTNAELQMNRAPFFVSAAWHVQEPTAWPIMYQSACETLQDDGMLGRALRRADGYLEYRRVFVGLAERLGLSFWELEQLCVRLGAEPTAVAVEGSDEAASEEVADRQRVWLIAPGPGASKWDEFHAEGIVAIGWAQLGDLTKYPDLEAIRAKLRAERTDGSDPMNNSLACYEFARAMQIGDILFAKRGQHEIVGYGIVSSEYRYEPARHYPHVRRVDWKLKGSWKPRERRLSMKTLTEIGQYEGLMADIRNALDLTDKPTDLPPPPVSGFTLDDAARELFAPREQIAEALELLLYKKNLVLQGPPGVGKTFFARHLAYLLLGAQDSQRVCQVQFHPSYAYEDFVQGYRPVDGGTFSRVDGPFLDFCDLALQDPASPHVLIIDEINRGNLSKIFGELLSLVEADKREKRWAVRLAYSRENEPPFHVPKNLHIIGTMNTADRSLALVDYALRRRFAFLDMQPGFELPAFVLRLSRLGVEPALRDRIIGRIRRLNVAIRNDATLGEGFCVGHSYFCHKPDGGTADEAWYKRIIRTEIEPLLGEYWYDARDRVKSEVAQLLDDD